MTTQSTPMFRKVDLNELVTEGVLLAANESFFWPLGLALTWTVDTAPVAPDHWCGNERSHDAHDDCQGTVAGGNARDLHVRQWEYEDGHHESIGSDEADPVYAERRARWHDWFVARGKMFPPGPEQDRYLLVASIVPSWLGPTPIADKP